MRRRSRLRAASRWTSKHAGFQLALRVGFVSYGLSHVLYISSLQILGTVRAGNYYSRAPFFGAALGVLILHEPLTLRLAGAAALMAVGIWLDFTGRHEHAHVHESLEHDHRHVHDSHHQHQHKPGDPPEEPHSHPHKHDGLTHTHAHYPDIHHRHEH